MPRTSRKWSAFGKKTEAVTEAMLGRSGYQELDDSSGPCAAFNPLRWSQRHRVIAGISGACLLLLLSLVFVMVLIAQSAVVDEGGELPTDSVLSKAFLRVDNAFVQYCDGPLSTELQCALRAADSFCVGHDGKILAIGDAATVKAEPGCGDSDDTSPLTVFNAMGNFVFPGFTDGHAHLMNLGLMLRQADLMGCAPAVECAQRLVPFAQNTTRNSTEWLLARGWNQEFFPGRAYPTKEVLDNALGSGLPIWLRRVDGHAAWGNSEALRRAGITAATPDPPGGEIIRDNVTGEPTGIFVDNAMDIVEAFIPGRTDASLALDLQRAQESLWSLGITGVHDAGVGNQTVSVMREALGQGNLGLRIYSMVSAEADLRWGEGRRRRFLPDEEARRRDVFNNIDLWCQRGHQITDHQDGSLHVRSTKLFMDGALGSRGALLYAPYSDDPSATGLRLNNATMFHEMTKKWLGCDFQVGSHAIGDKANGVVLDGYESATAELGLTKAETRALRLRMEHAQIVQPADRARFVELSVIASMQPTHATSDMYMAESRIGLQRCAEAYTWRSFLNQSTPLCFGSDFPVERADPLLGVFAAVTRQKTNGTPTGGWFPLQKLSRAETLHGFTVGPAWASFTEDRFGSLSAGYFADFVVLDRDILDDNQPPIESILGAKVLKTFVGGIQKYSSR